MQVERRQASFFSWLMHFPLYPRSPSSVLQHEQACSSAHAPHHRGLFAIPAATFHHIADKPAEPDEWGPLLQPEPRSECLAAPLNLAVVNTVTFSSLKFYVLSPLQILHFQYVAGSCAKAAVQVHSVQLLLWQAS